MEEKGTRKLLLVEDEAILALAQKMTLEKYGYQVKTVHTGEKAVEAAGDDPEIDLILMDIDLGSGISGDQAAEQILLGRHIPIVFLTSHTEQEYVERVKKITRYGYVIKNSGEFVLWDAIKVAFELFEANEQLERFFSVNLDLLCINDIEGYFIKVNTAWEEILGHTVDELKKSKFLDFVHPEDIDATVEAMNRLGRQEELVNFVNRCRSKDGSYRYIEWRSHPSGGLVYAAARDVTDRIEYERVFRESENRFRRLVENAPDAIFVQTNGTFSYLNPAALKLFGATKQEELIGIPVVDHFHEADRDQVRGRIRTLNEDRMSVPRIRETCLQLDGTEVSAEVSAVPFDYGGQQGALVFARSMEQEKELEQEYRTVFNGTQDAMFLINVEGNTFTYKRNNRSHAELTGLSTDEIVGKTPRELLGDQAGAVVHSNYEKCVQAKAPISYEETLKFPAGERIWETTLTPIMKGDRVDEIVGSARDITARKRDREQIDALLAEQLGGSFRIESDNGTRGIVEFPVPEDDGVD